MKMNRKNQPKRVLLHSRDARNRLFGFLLLMCALDVNPANSQCPLSCLPDGAVYELSPLHYDAGYAKFTTIMSKIPELSDLGVKTIYLMPIFKSSGLGSNASDSDRAHNQYNIEDYYQIDSYYGTTAELKSMIDTAHVYGLRVLFDLVLNHTFYPSVFFDSAWDYRIAMSSLASTASSLGYQVQYDTIGSQVFPYVNKRYTLNDSTYDFRGWLHNGTVHAMHYPTWTWWIALDYANPGLIQYIINLSKYFIAQYDFDGWRLDAPANNWNPNYFSGNHSMVALLQSVKDAMTALKPSCVMISEDAGSSRRDSDPKDFDQMVEASYDPQYTLNTLATVGAINLKAYQVPHLLAEIPNEHILYGRSRLRYSETHDNPRVATYSSELNRPLLLFNATIYPGVPMIQAGQEIGATTLLHSVPVNGYDSSQLAMRRFYRKVLRTRNAHNSLKYGSLQNVLVSTTANDTTRVYSYVRSYNGEQILVIVNFTDQTVTNTLNLPFSPGTMLRDSMSSDTFTVNTPSKVAIQVPAYSGRILIPNLSTSVPVARELAGHQFEFSLCQNYPNPFNPVTVISYQLPVMSRVILRIFDLLGREVAVLVNDVKSPGAYRVTWDATGFPSGVYYSVLTVGGQRFVKATILLK